MWVLILAIASLLAFLVITLLLWLADALESHSRLVAGHTVPATSFTMLSVSQAFEPVYCRLWTDPIQALELVQSTGRRGLPVSRLRPIFRKAAARYPEIYDGYSFEQWLQLLVDSVLIDWSGQTLTLTEEGHAFLEYRFTTEALLQS